MNSQATNLSPTSGQDPTCPAVLVESDQLPIEPAEDLAGAIDKASAQLVEKIRTHIAKGDRCKEKAEQHYIAAGQHLRTLKAEHKGSWSEWEELIKNKIGIGKSRASELMQIADGTKTAESVASDRRERQRKAKAPSVTCFTHTLQLFFAAARPLLPGKSKPDRGLL
jgi:hypothetical protein